MQEAAALSLMTLTSAAAIWTTIGAALVMMSTSGTAFVATSTTSPRSSTGNNAATRRLAHARRAEETCHDLPGAAATTAKPNLATASRDFETFFDRYLS